jgi:metallo-beta-lactamase family protein
MCEVFDKMRYINMNEKHILNEYVTYRLVNSGHVLGGCMIELWIRKPNNTVKHIVYTSDMGSDCNNEFQYFVPKREVIPKCNLLISEATYNNPNRSFSRKDSIQEREQLKREIKENLVNGKRILFSAFSFSRFQNLMCMLYDWFHDEDWIKDYPIILDGKLCHKINSTYLEVLEDEEKEYFEKVLNWKGFKKINSYDGTMAILSKRTVGIYIATSGFLTSGKIVTFLQQFLGNSKDVVYITGYCGNESSIGYKILNKEQKTVTLDKVTIYKRAEVKQLKTFSSHIQFDELINMYKQMQCDKILIHHSSKTEKEEFANIVRSELRKVDKFTKVDVVSENNYQFVL